MEGELKSAMMQSILLARQKLNWSFAWSKKADSLADIRRLPACMLASRLSTDWLMAAASRFNMVGIIHVT